MKRTFSKRTQSWAFEAHESLSHAQEKSLRVRQCRSARGAVLCAHPPSLARESLLLASETQLDEDPLDLHHVELEVAG